MRQILAVALAAVLATGCASNAVYYETVTEVERLRAERDAMRSNALLQALQTGDPTTKALAVAALMASGQANKDTPVQAPQNEALQWASILVPGVTQGLQMFYSYRAQTHASDNALASSVNSNSTFVKFAEQINDPVVVTQPAPTIVTQPAPLVVNPVIVQPEPIIVEPVFAPTAP